MTQPDPLELLTTLEDCMASPVADALRRAVVGGRRSDAMKLIKSEVDFSQEECDVLYVHLKTMLRGKNVTFEEVPKKEWASLAAELEAKYKANDYRTTETVLVRYGSQLFNAQPIEMHGRLYVLAARSEMVEFSKLDQVWRLVPK